VPATAAKNNEEGDKTLQDSDSCDDVRRVICNCG
jgi:hypothetical protein